ncbi:MAG: apolipoprotein N-acyltransferase, partial [Clostridia bacterium]|nr:apolipoprotein N-acyltransferase [Clostridia bacterium]
MIKKEKKASNFPKALLRFFLYALCGALTALPLTLPSLWFVGWVAPAPVIYSELYLIPKKDSYAGAYGRGMSFFWFFGAVVFYWFSELYPLDFLGFDKGAALITVILATCGIPLLQAVVSSLAFVIICLMRRRSSVLSHPFLFSALAAALFVLAEYSHTLTWAGVPWGRFAVGQIACLANIQSAALFGSYFITFIMVFFASLLAFAARDILNKAYRKALICTGAALSIFLANFIYGSIVLAIPAPSSQSAQWVTVGATQGNIRYEEKWLDKEGHTMDVYKKLTLSAAEDGCSLILWPETAIPYNLRMNYRMEEYYRSLAEKAGTEIIVTSFENDDGNLYNTARLLSPDGTLGTSVYKKRHLVPFGEYTPLEDFIETVFPPLAEMSAISDPLSPGVGTEIIETENGPVGVLICFDSIYED